MTLGIALWHAADEVQGEISGGVSRVTCFLRSLSSTLAVVGTCWGDSAIWRRQLECHQHVGNISPEECSEPSAWVGSELCVWNLRFWNCLLWQPRLSWPTQDNSGYIALTQLPSFPKGKMTRSGTSLRFLFLSPGVQQRSESLRNTRTYLIAFYFPRDWVTGYS